MVKRQERSGIKGKSVQGRTGDSEGWKEKERKNNQMIARKEEKLKVEMNKKKQETMKLKNTKKQKIQWTEQIGIHNTMNPPPQKT